MYGDRKQKPALQSLRRSEILPVRGFRRQQDGDIQGAWRGTEKRLNLRLMEGKFYLYAMMLVIIIGICALGAVVAALIWLAIRELVRQATRPQL